jgi:predicted DCC family thiol-disulfide oxidoreductase YuxK
MKYRSIEPKSDEQEIWIVYDGLCPFCSSYVTLYRIRELVSKVHLIDARDSNEPLVKEVSAMGFDLHEGMVVKWDGRFYHGADCLHVLALLGADSSLFNRFNRWIFTHRAVSRRLYPLLVAGRKLTLRILRRPALQNL